MSKPQILAEVTGNLPKDSEQKIKSTGFLYYLSMRTPVGGSIFQQDQEHVAGAREIWETGKLEGASQLKYGPREANRVSLTK